MRPDAELARTRTPGVRERSARVIRLKEELNLILEVVVHAREALSNELKSEVAQKKLSIDAKFLGKLRALTSAYRELTDARIRLDKSERTLEKELTPAEELEAVREHVLSLENPERGKFLRDLIRRHNSLMKAKGNKVFPDFVVTDEEPDDNPDTQ